MGCCHARVRSVDEGWGDIVIQDTTTARKIRGKEGGQKEGMNKDEVYVLPEQTLPLSRLPFNLMLHYCFPIGFDMMLFDPEFLHD